MPNPTACLLIIGNEVLSGRTKDANLQFLGTRLGEIGIPLREELGIEVSDACLAPFTFASHDAGRFHLLMPLYLCRRWEGQVTAREGQALAWVRPNKLADYAMPPADKPLVALLRDFL